MEGTFGTEGKGKLLSPLKLHTFSQFSILVFAHLLSPLFHNTRHSIVPNPTPYLPQYVCQFLQPHQSCGSSV